MVRMERYSEIAIFESQFEQKLDYCSFTTISFETPKSPQIKFFGESKSKSRLFRTREDADASSRSRVVAQTSHKKCHEPDS